MKPCENAVAALVDDSDHLKGTGFVCEAGVLITCAHIFGPSGGGSEVTAIFGEGEAQQRQRFRVSPKGWFPRRKARLSDEPDKLCDVAILTPVESSKPPPQGPKIARQSPSGGTLDVTGYYAVLHKDTIHADLEGSDHPGWIRAKPTDPKKDAPKQNMSGSPAFHEHIDGVVGMLAYGQEEGRGMWLLVPAETLTLAIIKVIGNGPSGPNLWVRQIKSDYRVARYATCQIGSPSQRHQAGEPLSVDFDAFFHTIPDNLPHLRQVEVAISIEPLDTPLDRELGSSPPYQCRSGIEINYIGPLGDAIFAWKVRAPEADGTLHGRNAIPSESLFALQEPSPDQQLTVEMVAFANNEDFAPDNHVDIPDRGASYKVISRARQTIVNRLKMKLLTDPQKNGEIILCVTHNSVQKARE